MVYWKLPFVYTPLLVWLILQTDFEGKQFIQENKYLGKKSIYSERSIYYLFIAKGMGKFIRYMEGSFYRPPPIFVITTKMFVILSYVCCCGLCSSYRG